MKKIKYLIISTIIFPFVAFSQSYTIDTTWCPDSIFLHPYQTEFPLVSGIAEHEDGRVFIAGQFGRNGHPSLSSIVFFNIDGSVNPDFDRFLYSNYVNYTTYCEVSGDTLIFARWGVVANKFDIFGNWLMYDYDLNFHEDIDCSVFYNIYLYPDGSLLATGHDIRLYSDPTRYELIKLKPDGHLDSSVVISPEETPNTYIEEVFRYDENRFLAYGRFDSWYGYPINDFCRFYIETGEIDTTFHNIFSEGGPASVRVLPDGKILLVGIFRFPGDTTYYGITRLNPDGSLDSSFNTFNSAKVICPTEVFSVETLCPLNDSDYLVGGIFRQFQGYERGSIAKIDKNGFLDTTVFNEAGFDSSHWSSSKGLVTLIKPAKNNKYYIGGQFKYFNGQRVSSVIRINGNQEFSIDNPEVSSLQLFPNPANDKLTINASTIIDEIEIYNISGCLLQKTKINKTNVSLDVSALPVGNFLLRATSNDEVFVKKFVVLR